MKITTQHKDSKHGLPIILDKNGAAMDYREGLIEAIEKLGWTRQELATKSGMKPRGLEPVFAGKFAPNANVLNVLGDALEKLKTK